MNRQDLIKGIGNLKPSFDKNNVHFKSQFIIPIPHDFFRNKDINSVKKLEENWDIKNDSIEKDLWLGDIKQYITKNLISEIKVESNEKKIDKNELLVDKIKKTFKKFVNPEVTEELNKTTIQTEDDKNDNNKFKEILTQNLNLLLTNKNTNQDFTLCIHNRDGSEDCIDILLEEIDLWILKGDIAFFVYKIGLTSSSNQTINCISTKINRSLRDIKNLSIDESSKKLIHGKKEKSESEIDFLSYLTSLTKVGTTQNSFLNIEENRNKEDTLNKVISDSTHYAKMLTALHVEQDSIISNDEEKKYIEIMDSLNYEGSYSFGILEELSYLLGTTSAFSFDTEKSFIANPSYTYDILQKSGINIWKYWSGVALSDSLSFFSVKDGGAGIVYASKSTNYFLYILNLYVITKLKVIEEKLIDTDFINIQNIYSVENQIQQLQNQHITTEVSARFQPNVIHSKINEGLNTEKLLKEAKHNILRTMKLTKSNTDLVFTIFTGFIAFIGIDLSKEMIIEGFKHHTFLTLGGMMIAIGLLALVYVKRSAITKFFKKFKNFVEKLEIS